MEEMMDGVYWAKDEYYNDVCVYYDHVYPDVVCLFGTDEPYSIDKLSNFVKVEPPDDED